MHKHHDTSGPSIRSLRGRWAKSDRALQSVLANVDQILIGLEWLWAVPALDSAGKREAEFDAQAHIGFARFKGSPPLGDEITDQFQTHIARTIARLWDKV